MWDRVQVLLKQRSKPFAGGTIGLFARKALCLNCGYTMRSSKNRDKHYLLCSNRHVAKDACEGAFISVDKLEEIVLAEINSLAAEYLDKSELERNIKISVNLEEEKKKRLLADLAIYEKKVAEFSKGIQALYMDKIKGVISEQDFAEMSKSFAAERGRLTEFINEKQKQLSGINETLNSDDITNNLIEKYSNFKQLNREIVEILIDRIYIGKRIPGTKDIPIEIH